MKTIFKLVMLFLLSSLAFGQGQQPPSGYVQPVAMTGYTANGTYAYLGVNSSGSLITTPTAGILAQIGGFVQPYAPVAQDSSGLWHFLLVDSTGSLKISGGVPSTSTPALCLLSTSTPGTTTWGSCSGSSSSNFSTLVADAANTTGGTYQVGNSTTWTFTGTGVVNSNQINGAVVPTSATVLGSNTSNQLAAATTTGSGTTVVLQTGASLITPALGVATATSVNGLTLTALATGYSIAGGTTSKTLTVDTTASVSAFALTANPLSQFAATTSAQLAGVISDETGTGALVFGTGPTIAGGTLSGTFAGTPTISGVWTFSSTQTLNTSGTATNSTNVNSAASTTNASYSILAAASTSGFQEPSTIASFTINPSTGAVNIPGALTVSSCTGCGGAGTVSSVSNSDGSLSITPTTGAVVASLDIPGITNPTGTPTGTPSSSGGTVAAGSNFAKIVALDSTGRPTAVGSESSVVTTTTGASTITWNWTAVTGASNYQIWVGSSSGTEANFFTSSTNSYTQTTAIILGAQDGFLSASNFTGGPNLTLSSTVMAPAGTFSNPGLCVGSYFGICFYEIGTTGNKLAWRDATGAANQVSAALSDEGVDHSVGGAERWLTGNLTTAVDACLVDDGTSSNTLAIAGPGSGNCGSPTPNQHSGNLKLTNENVYGSTTWNGSSSGSISLSATATGGTLNIGSNVTVTGAGALTVTSCSGCGSVSLAFPLTVSGTTNSGGMPYFSSTTVLTSSAMLTQYGLLAGGGTGAAPTAVAPGTNQGTYLVGRVNTVQGTPTAPIDIQVGDCATGGRAISGAGSPTVAYSDIGCTIVHARGDTNVQTVTIPTPTTLNNPAPKFGYENDSNQIDVLTPTTYTIAKGSAAAASTLNVPAGSYCTVSLDPSLTTVWEAICHPNATSAGTVTSVAETVPSGFAIGGSPITTSGTLAITYSVSGAGQIINSSALNTASFTSTVTLGVSGTAGTLALFPASGNFTTTLGSAATASNTILFPITVPTTLHSVYCVTASTTCTLTDTGYAYNAIPLSSLATQAANTTVANVTGGTAAPTAAAIPAGIQFYTLGTGYSTATSANLLSVCTTCVTSAASLTNNALMAGAGSQGSQTITTGTGVVTALGVNTGSAGAFVVNGGALGTPSSGTGTNISGIPENNLTGASAAGTITEGGATFSVTRAGIATANLTAPWVFQNTNSSNNNTSITMGISAPGTSTGQTVLNVNGASTGGDLADFGTGGTWTAGVLSGQTIVASVLPTGAFQSKGTTAGFVAYTQGSTSAAVAPCNAANTICDQAPTAVTAGVRTLPGALAQGLLVHSGTSSAIQEGYSGDSGHAVKATSQTASISTATLCAATAGTACGQAGQYRITANFWGSGTACSVLTAGSVALTLTWTDENAVTHSAIGFPMWDETKGAMETAFYPNTALGTESAGGSWTISTNGAVIQYATTYTACTTGTLTYNVRLTAEPLQ